MSWGDPQNKLDKFLQTALAPAATAYGVGIYARALGYASGTLSRTKLSVPVLSVGNLSVGGTGKTPITIDLARCLTECGHRVAILSRGYKRRSQMDSVLVSDGQHLLASCQDAGDEPYLIAKLVPKAIVLVGSDRVTNATEAVEKHGAQIILLDDGFQHVRLSRDIDIVLFDYNDDPKTARLLPAGRLREPLSALGRASTVVVSRIPVGCDSMKIGRIRETVRRYNPKAEICLCQFKPRASVNLKGARVVAFSGIARPQSFVESLEELQATLAGQVSFGDHHWFEESDLAKIDALAIRQKADLIVTTQKDLVRLPNNQKMSCPLVAVEQETVWLTGPPKSLAQWLSTAGGGKSTSAVDGATTTAPI